MADDIKKLNATVTEAVNILKLWVGNSGQIKARNEKQQKIIDEWLGVVDEAKENEKKKRAFTERQRDEHGKFIKKQDDQAKEFLGIAGSIKGLFSSAAKGMTTSITSMVSGITKHVSRFFGELKSQFTSLFGEESEFFGLLLSIKDAVTGFAGTIIGWIWKKTPSWANKMTKYLQGMYNLQVKQMKMDFLEAGGTTDKKVSIMGILGALVFAIGAAIGGFMHRYFVLLTKLPLFAKVTKMFTKIKNIPFLGKLFKSLKFGFKILGWPITLLLSVIDFIKGFKETEGSLWEKIKGGLWGALEGFIELPIKFIGWVVEKIMGLFGVELTNVGDTILEKMKTGLDFILEISPWNNIVKFWTGLFGTEGTFSEKFIGGIESAFGGMIDLFKSIWNSTFVKKVGEVITKGFENLVIFIDNIMSNIKKYVIDIIGKIPGIGWLKDSLGLDKKSKTKTSNINYKENLKRNLSNVNKLDTEKTKVQSEHDKKVMDLLQKSNLLTKEAAQNTSNAINNISSMQNNSDGGGDVRQIPDELDNSLMGISNHNGAME